jgi:hypothetical protein
MFYNRLIEQLIYPLLHTTTRVASVVAYKTNITSDHIQCMLLNLPKIQTIF